MEMVKKMGRNSEEPGRKSRRPKSNPRKQKPWEIELVKRMRKKYGKDLLLGYQKAREKGYKRSYGCFKRTAEKEIPLKKKAPKRKNKPYQRASYPGQKVQIDVKYVPSYCVADGRKYYQYTAKDECTRWTYREMYDEHSIQFSAVSSQPRRTCSFYDPGSAD